jgi:ABC-type molybdate transport system permease subunit
LATAALVTLFDFPGRGMFEWLLLLPLAMPAYVVAYAYTDFLQFSGPLQVALRETLGLQGRLWPDVRSVWGAALVFTLSLYPYVYLLARTALVERASGLMEAARLLGAPLSRRIREIALPLARPAVAAGVALALMETLADFGVSSYFGIQTFTAGIYKAWLSMDNRIAAAQLATVLLADDASVWRPSSTPAGLQTLWTILRVTMLKRVWLARQACVFHADPSAMNAVRVVAAFVQEIGSLIRQDWLRVKGDIRQEGGVCPTWFRGRTASLPAAEFKSRWCVGSVLARVSQDAQGSPLLKVELRLSSLPTFPFT